MKTVIRATLAATLAVVGLIANAAQPAAAATRTESGYWMMASDGHVYGFGGAADLGSPTSIDGRVKVTPTPTGNGYWVLSSVGSIYNYGDAKTFGSVPFLGFGDEEYTTMAATPTGKGYWLFTNTGKVMRFGDATFYGDMSNVKLNGPVLDAVATPSGHGYYMVGSDGGVFTFGDATFHGSTGKMRLNKPVMSLAPDPDGAGYWLVASDGGIFGFDAPFYGSAGSLKLNKPISGMVASPTGHGYLMVAMDGGIFSFGDVPFHGSLGANPPAFPVVSVAAIGDPPPLPTLQNRVVLKSSGSSETWQSQPFQLDAGVADLTYACAGTGGYVGNCYIELHDYASGDQTDYVSQTINSGAQTAHFHVPTAGTYYIEVAIFASTTRGWAFELDQQVCTANCDFYNV